MDLRNENAALKSDGERKEELVRAELEEQIKTKELVSLVAEFTVLEMS